MVLRALTACLFGLLVLLGTTAIARAASPDRPLPSAALAAPFCDDRAASAYADEPRPVPTDGGTIAQRSSDPCAVVLAEASIALPAPDDLQRTPPTPREVALLPLPVPVPVPTVKVLAYALEATDAARDGFHRIEQPPPRAHAFG